MARLELGVDVTVEGARELQRVSDSLDGTSDELDDLATLLDRAADNARKLSDDVDRASESINFDRATASAQRFEDTGEGIRNGVNGITDLFSAATDETASFGERLALAAGGMADVASGMRNAVLPALQSISQGALTSAATVVRSIGSQVIAWAGLGVQSLLHAGKVALAWAIALGPIGILVAAVVAAVALIIANWEHVSKFLGQVFTAIGKALEAVGKVFVDVWEGVIDFLGGIMDTIADIGKKLWEPIGEGFAAAIDFIRGIWNSFARWWNSIEISVPSVDVPFVGKVGGFAIGLPDLPMLAEGGIVDSPTLAIIGEKGPEAVVPLDQMPSGITIEVNVLGDLRAEDEESVAAAIGRVLWSQGLTDSIFVGSD